MVCLKLLNHNSQTDGEQECLGFTLPADRKVLSQVNLALTLKQSYSSLASLLTMNLCLKVVIGHFVIPCQVAFLLLWPWDFMLPWQWLCPYHLA